VWLKITKGLSGSFQLFLVSFEGSHEGQLVCWRLEPTVAKLGGSVDELEVDALQGTSLRMDQQTLSQCENALLGPNTTSLDHDEIIVDFTVVRETSHWSDALLRQVVLGRGIVDDLLSVLRVDPISNSVDFLVHLRSVVVPLLTGTGNSELDTRRMPGSDTSHLPQTLVRLTRELLRVPTGSHTFGSFSLGHSNDVDHLVLGEDLLHWNWLLEVLLGPIQLLRDAAAVQLDFHDVGLLLTLLQELHLSVGDDPDDLAILLHDLEVVLNLLLSKGILPLLAALSESLLLGLVPVLVESTATVLTQMLSPDKLQGSETMRSLDVTNDSDDDNRWGLNDSNGLHDFLLVHLGARFVGLTNNVRHTSLVAKEGSQMNWSLGVILWESLDLSTVTL